MNSETAAQALRAKNDKLESLCRALQQERNKLNEQLKEFQSQKVSAHCPSLSLSLGRSQGVALLVAYCDHVYSCLGATVGGRDSS